MERLLNVRDVAQTKPKQIGAGIPRMTFFTVFEAAQKPVVVLGFTAPAWRDKALKKWAGECRGQDVAEYEGLSCMTRRKDALNAIHQAKIAAGTDWTSSKRAATIQQFRVDDKLSNLDRDPHGPRGLAFSFPHLESRVRCTVCLCSTDFRVTGEDGRTLEDMATGEEIWKWSCAELEATIVIEDLKWRTGGRIKRMWGKVSGPKGLLPAMTLKLRTGVNSYKRLYERTNANDGTSMQGEYH